MYCGVQDTAINWAVIDWAVINWAVINSEDKRILQRMMARHLAREWLAPAACLPFDVSPITCPTSAVHAADTRCMTVRYLDTLKTIG